MKNKARLFTQLRQTRQHCGGISAPGNRGKIEFSRLGHSQAGGKTGKE